ncbi:MAG: hypothetical protein RJB61_2208 [Actinomycetota bacterium]
MPRFEPFTALRYASSLPLDAVAAPPYDVLSDSDVDRLRRLHPSNIVHVDVPREADGPTRYDDAAQRLEAWVAEGTMVADATPSFTLYRMSFTDSQGRSRNTVGVLGALEVVDEGAGGVLPHERTTPKAKTDRLDLTRATRANLSPVWGLSLAKGLTSLLAAPATEMGSCRDEQGVLHTVERIDDTDRIAHISKAISASPVLIADGHHRYAISRTYRDEVRASGATNSGAELTLTYVAELVENQLSIDAIHRLYSGIDADGLLDVLRRSFDTSDAGVVDAGTAGEMMRRGSLCFVGPDGRGTWLTPRRGAFEGVRNLDGALLEHALSAADVEVAYQHGVDHVTSAVRSGACSAAVLIRPTDITEIRRTADERLLMPPKSTFFTPKLRTGLVVRRL